MILTKDYLKKEYPSIFAVRPSPNMSDKYTMLSSENILNKMEEFGYYPTSVKQASVRKPENNGYQTHTIRFRHENFANMKINVNDVVPELVFLNSHNGRVLAKMFAGLFRLVCSNGLVVADSKLGGIAQKHMGITSEELEGIIYSFAQSTDSILSSINDYRKIELNDMQRKKFAEISKEGIYGKDSKVNPESLLRTRRPEDQSKDLFTIYNVVQENITKGGIEYKSEKRNTKTKEIKSATRDLEINTFLWGLMDRVAKGF